MKLGEFLGLFSYRSFRYAWSKCDSLEKALFVFSFIAIPSGILIIVGRLFFNFPSLP